MHLAAEMRRNHGAVPVWHVYYYPRKRQRIQHTYQTCNLSLVVAGRGRYRFEGEDCTVRAPCVLTQWCDQVVDYGPEPQWEELALRFDRSHRERIADLIGYDSRRPLWPLTWTPSLQQAWRLVAALLEADPRRAIDRFDRAVECLLLSLRDSHRGDDPVALGEAMLTADLSAVPSLDAIADKVGLSTAHLRRLWRQRHGCAPGPWLERRRCAEACRLLLDHELSVRSVAQTVGFTDPLHFSRRFRHVMGQSPSQWRRNERA